MTVHCFQFVEDVGWLLSFLRDPRNATLIGVYSVAQVLYLLINTVDIACVDNSLSEL